MIYKDFSMADHGFVGHMAEPENKTDRAVIVIMGGEKSILPGKNVAERFAQLGFAAVAVSLYGAEGLPKGVDGIPLDMFEKVISYLRNECGYGRIASYGMSMGSLFAAMSAIYFEGIDKLIMVSPSHAVFEGSADKKHMSGRSVMTLHGKDIPFVKPDFEHKKMYDAFRDSYLDKSREDNAAIPVERAKADILMLASDSDESWPAAYSVRYLKDRLKDNNYSYKYKAVIYRNSSHILGVMPDPKKHKWLYWLAPLAYSSMRKHRRESMAAIDKSEKEIAEWLEK
ncbi:MAG: acyl-CoA thioester hydrolase/BAAT C-terminal domain-containing protein [Oscillospiraceae bacterium]